MSRQSKDEWYEFHGVEFEHETAKARLVVFQRVGEVWVPKSQSKKTGEDSIQIKGWFCDKEHLTEYGDLVGDDSASAPTGRLDEGPIDGASYGYSDRDMGPPGDPLMDDEIGF